MKHNHEHTKNSNEKSNSVIVFCADIYAWWAQIKEICIISAAIGFIVGQYFARILGNECAAWNLCNAPNTESFGPFIAFEDLHGHLRTLLNDTIFAQQFIASTNIVTLEYHRWIMVFEVANQSSIGAVPILNGNFAALATLGGATVWRETTLILSIFRLSFDRTYLSAHEQIRICDTRRSIWIEFCSKMVFVMYLKSGMSWSLSASDWLDVERAFRYFLRTSTWIGYISRPFDMSLCFPEAK